MNSSQLSTPEHKTLPAPVQPAFDWIEVFAIPIAANIMETQPLVLLMFFAAVFIAGSTGPLPLGEIGITLLLLGFQAWAMFINYRLRRGLEQRTATILHVSGVIVAFGLTIVASLNALNLPLLVIIAGLVIFCWKRGIDKARVKLDPEQLIFVFKLGLGILLVVLILSVLASAGQLTDVLVTLTYALPLFFLSGIISLSFTRVSMIKREYALQGIPQSSSTRSWLVALTFLWGVMVAGALIFETFSFPTLQKLLLPLWNILVTVVAIIIYVIFWIIASILRLIGSLFHFKTASVNVPPAPTQSIPSAQHLPPGMDHFLTWLFLIVQFLLVAIVFSLLFLLARAILRHTRLRLKQDSADEIRETLSMRTILRERRQERKSQFQPKVEMLLDTLDPDSARARYREFLQQMAVHGKHLSRRSEETPVEYQERLLALMNISVDDMVSDREMLADLTDAYINERYGERSVDLQPYGAVSTWISRMAERLGEH